MGAYDWLDIALGTDTGGEINLVKAEHQAPCAFQQRELEFMATE